MAVSWLYSVFVLINTTPNDDDWKAGYAESLKIIEQERRSLAELNVRHDKLGRAYAAVKEELELLKRRIHVAKAERIDVSQLQLQFDELTKALDALVEQAAEPVAEVTPNARPSPITFLLRAKSRRSRVGAPVAEGASHRTGQVLFTSGSSEPRVFSPRLAV